MSYSLAFAGGPGAILISSMEDGRGGGGVFSWDGESVERVADDHTMGMTFTGDRFARLLSGMEDTGAVGELVIYDVGGVRTYHRIDGAAHPHDLAYDADLDRWLIVAAGEDKVLWVDPCGRITRAWTAPDRPSGRRGDAWHVNCLAKEQGAVFVTAFGENIDSAERIRRLAEPRGFLLNLDDPQPVLSGLITPHNPTWVEGHWVVCGSWEGTVDKYDPGGERVARVTLGGWTRGLARVGNHLVVGVSGARHTAVGSASVAVIELERFVEVDRIALATREIYDVVHVPAEVVDWVKIGWNNNPARRRHEMRSRVLAMPLIGSLARWAQRPGRLQRAVWRAGRRSARTFLPGPRTEAGALHDAPPLNPSDR